MVTPVPKREIENKSVGSSKVIPSIMTDEDRLRLFGKTPTEAAFLEGIEAGKTILQLEKEWRMKPNTLYTLVKKWGLTGIVTTIKQDKPLDETPSDKGSDHMDPKFKLSKEEYLLKRVGGMTRLEISKNHEVAYANLLNYWLKKWGIKDELQEEIAMQEVIAKAAAETKDKSVLGFSRNNNVSDLVNTINQEDSHETHEDKVEALTEDEPEALTEHKAESPVNEESTASKAVIESDVNTPVIRSIFIEIPINSSEGTRLKVHSFIDSFANEFEVSGMDYRKALNELLQLTGNFVTLLHEQMEQFIVEGDPVDYLDKFVRKHNRHYISSFQAVSE